jgi:hypothetical protein
MASVLGEAWEMVEGGQMSEADFRDFVFVNPITLHAGMNPGFFRGTRVEQAADQLLGTAAV